MVDRCPISLMRQPLIQQAMALFPFYKRGITPNARGIRHETAFYRDVMGTLEALTPSAASWFQEQLASKKKGK